MSGPPALKKMFQFFKLTSRMADKHLVCEGALCKCQYGTTPDKLKVLYQTKHYINDPDGATKLVATDKDIGQTFEKNTFGSCAQQNNMPCQAVVAEWKGLYDKVKLSHGGKPLLEDAKATCPIGGPGCITLTTHGQVAEITEQDFEQADPNALAILFPFGDLTDTTSYKKIPPHQ